MRLGMVAGLALLAMAAATPAAAIPTADWAIFIEDSYSNLSRDDGEPDWEDHLFAAAEEEPDIARAVARFARVIGVDPAKAKTYADAIVAATVFRERCDADHCQLGAGEPDYDRVMTPALAEPTGELLWAIGQNLGTDRGALGPIAFSRAVQGHPQRVRVLTRLYEYSRDEVLLVSLLLDRPRDPALLSALLGAGASVSGGPDRWDGWQLAVLETSARRAAAQGAPAGEQAIYAQTILARYFNLGLTDQGLDLYRAYPAEVRALLPLASPPCDENDQGCTGREAGEVLADELTSALWLAGDHAGAEALSLRAEARLGEAGQWDARPRRLAVLDAIERSRPVADLFRLMVEGDDLNPEGHYSGMSGDGWMFLTYGPGSRALVAERLRDAGYDSIARVISGRDLYYRNDRGGYEDGLSRMSDFPPEVEARRRELAAGIEAAWAAAGGDSRSARAAAATGHSDGWTEARLPAGLAPWTAPAGRDDEAEAPPPSELDDLPVPAAAVLRHEIVEGEHYVLFQSTELDLPGEIPAYGVWLVRTERDDWTDPVYLGLQQHFPYVVTRESELPLVEAGRLQIEVQVREIAPESITFPPVGLSLARQEDGVVVSRELADVFRDGDADGVTDVAETRLGLDPARADTDGDGRNDGVDPVPLTASSGVVPPARRALALAVLQQLTGHDAGALVMTPRPAQGDPLDVDDMLGDMGSPPPEPPRLRTVILVSNDSALFADLDLPFRLMVYTPEQIRRLSEGGAPFYPPSVEIHSSLDGRAHFVVWSASWVGGSFMARCPDTGGPCQVEEKSSWIT